MNLTKQAMNLACAGLMSLALGMSAVAQDDAAPKKEKKAKAPKAKPTMVKGTVKAVDAEAKTVTVTTEDGEEKVLQIAARTMITLRGPLLDGVQAGDKVQAMSKKNKEGAEELMKVTVSREGVSPGAKAKKPKKQPKEKKAPKKKKEKKKPADEAPVE